MEPIGGAVDDFRAALPAATAMNLKRTKETDPIVKPTDLIPWHEAAPVEPPVVLTPEQTAEQVLSVLASVVKEADGR